MRTIRPPFMIRPIGQSVPGVDIPLHAVVVEGLETRAGALGLKIYDPAGDTYWQPLSTFRKFFTGEFVTPI
jgi:hypothetical protein